VGRTSSQTNNFGIQSNCSNNETGIISQEGDGLTSSAQNEQSNKCFVSSTCPNNAATVNGEGWSPFAHFTTRTGVMSSF
jgi:hypothetical protein